MVTRTSSRISGIVCGALAGFVLASAAAGQADTTRELASGASLGILTRPDVLNGSVRLISTTTSFNPTAIPGGPAGSMRIRATFQSSGSNSIQTPFFVVTELSGGNVLLNADGDMPVPLANASGLPETCQDILSSNPAAPDGDYSIYPGNITEGFTVFCAGMQKGIPREYLSLVHTGDTVNFAKYGGESSHPPAAVVMTHYTKIRLDPATLLVDIGDQTFAASTGEDCCHGPTAVQSMPYGTASDCLAGDSNAGAANIDLGGTPFEVDDGFVVTGFEPVGSANGQSGTNFAAFHVASQVVNLTGGGFCGGIHPLPNSFLGPLENFNGGFNLQLKYLPHPGPGPMAARLSTDVGEEGILVPGESFTTTFLVGLKERRPLSFFVDIWGVQVPLMTRP